MEIIEIPVVGNKKWSKIQAEVFIIENNLYLQSQ